MRLATTVLRLAVVGLILGSGAHAGHAQPMPPAPPPPPGPPPHDRLGGPPPEAILQGLALDAKQRTAIRDLLDDEKKQEISLRAQIETAEIELLRAVEADSPDPKSVDKIVDFISSLEAKARKARLGSWLRVRALLTSEQRDRVRDMRPPLPPQSAVMQSSERITVEPYVVNLNEPGKPRYLKLGIEIAMSSEVRDREGVLGMMPKARDEVLRYLSGLTVADCMGEVGKYKIRDGVQARLNKGFGFFAVNRVYLSEFVVQ